MTNLKETEMEEKRIKAMKNGGVKIFSEMSWRIGKPEREGWVEVGVVSGAVMVNVEPVPIMKSEIDGAVTVEPVVEVEVPSQEEIDNDLYPTNDEIKDFIKEKTGITPHHNTGTKKLRALYDENTK